MDYFIFEFEILGSTGAIRIGNSTPLTLLKPAAVRCLDTSIEVAHVKAAQYVDFCVPY